MLDWIERHREALPVGHDLGGGSGMQMGSAPLGVTAIARRGAAVGVAMLGQQAQSNRYALAALA